MPYLFDHNKTLYRQIQYTNEKDFETVVVSLADQIFGPSSIYVDIKKKVSSKEIVTIPDGYVIDLEDPQSPRLFIVENEIVAHDPFRHIGIQILKFVTAFEDSQTLIRQFLMKEIESNSEQKDKLESACKSSDSRNIDNYLDKAVYGNFQGIVIIDEARTELHKVLEKINADVSVLELKSFATDDGRITHQFDTLYDEEESSYVFSTDPQDKITTSEDLATKRKRLTTVDTIVIPAREENFNKVFIGENQWYAIRIGAAMKQRLKYIAAYQVAPKSAVTHIAEVSVIRPYKDTGKYCVLFKEPAQEIKPIKMRESKKAPQGPVYVRKDDLLSASHFEDAFKI